MIAMRYVFLMLMCIFAGIYTAKNRNGIKAAYDDKASDFWDSASSVFFRIAASVMYVLIAIASHTGVKHESYYTLILVGLCISLAADILIIFNKSGKYMVSAGFLFYSAGAAAYTLALFLYAGVSWREAAIFTLLLALISAAAYNKKRNVIKRKLFILYVSLACIMTAKALSILFEQNGRYLYAVFAAAGATLFSVSQIMQELKPTVKAGQNDILNIIIYYAGQGLLALSVMI